MVYFVFKLLQRRVSLKVDSNLNIIKRRNRSGKVAHQVVKALPQVRPGDLSSVTGAQVAEAENHIPQAVLVIFAWANTHAHTCTRMRMHAHTHTTKNENKDFYNSGLCSAVLNHSYSHHSPGVSQSNFQCCILH